MDNFLIFKADHWTDQLTDSGDYIGPLTTNQAKKQKIYTAVITVRFVKNYEK